MRLDERQLDEYTDRFATDAFRYETLSYYNVPSDGGDFGRFLAGEDAPSAEVVGPWARWVATQRSRGAAVRRLRVLRHPPNDYLRFEMGWAYVANTAAGEDIRILDLTRRGQMPRIFNGEFWMLDRERIALMTYDRDGHFLHADTAEGVDATFYVDAAETAWDMAEPFISWWANHPGYHGPAANSA